MWKNFHAVRLDQTLSQLILIQDINYLSLKGNNLLTVVKIHNDSCRQGERQLSISLSTTVGRILPLRPCILLQTHKISLLNRFTNL